MRFLVHLIVAGMLLVPSAGAGQTEAATEQPPIAIAIHAGAGTISRESMTEDRERTIRGVLEKAVRAGYEVLERGGAAIDAVTAAITIMEDAPEFNAGRGAVLTSESRVEMDASIMTGQDLDAGAIASVSGLRHPILAARAVLEHSPHVMLVGKGAEEFARERQLEFMPESWFHTEFRLEQLRRIQSRENERTAAEDMPDYDSNYAFDNNGDYAYDNSNE